MTKEELRKEAEESAKKFFGKPTDLVDLDNLRIFKNGYLASAEPREKRIAELEAQIEKMKSCINDLVHLGEFNEHTDEEYFNYQVHEALNNAEQFIKEIKEK